MSFAGTILVLGCLCLVACHYWNGLYEEENPRALRVFLGWVGKGLAVPILLWTALNSGLASSLPPLSPQVSILRVAGASWASATLAAIAPGLLVIGSYWLAATLGWLATTIAIRARNRTEFFGLGAFWCLLLSPLFWSILHFGGSLGGGFAATVWLLPIVHCTLPLVPLKKPSPLYSRAIAKMKFGKYNDAELAILKELEKCEEDFEGWMMLADLYANHFSDLREADRTIRGLCSQPNVTGIQVSIACHRLADWHLKLGGDPAAARSALEAICLKCPGSHFDRMARQRIVQLPATREELRAQRECRPIRLPALRDSLEQIADPSRPETSEAEAAVLANACVEKLKRDPNNVQEREKLARVFAEHLDQADLAIEQLELLIDMPEQPVKKIAEWLSLMAAWQLNYRQDQEASRKILDRLVQEYPQTAQAFAAQRKLSLMEMELRISKAKSASEALPR